MTTYVIRTLCLCESVIINRSNSSRRFSAGHNPGDPLHDYRTNSKLVVRLDSRDQQSIDRQQRSVSVTQRQQYRLPQIGDRNYRSYRAPPALLDAGGNKRFFIVMLLSPSLCKAEASDSCPVE